jgi:hypothetical protein
LLELIGIVLLMTQDDGVEAFHGWAVFTERRSACC